MTLEQLIKLVRHEWDWLRYYSFRESKKQLTLDCNLYETLESIGYTKRVIPLDRRCPGGMITSSKKITNLTPLDELEVVAHLRDNDNNFYTPLEIYWMLFPEKRPEIIYEIQRDNS